jgi:hypothetical protein
MEPSIAVDSLEAGQSGPERKQTAWSEIPGKIPEKS